MLKPFGQALRAAPMIGHRRSLHKGRGRHALVQCSKAWQSATLINLTVNLSE
ncbi:MAG: hypothetical protein AB2811_04065 [Candidatus Sedimenticola endophacoides]